MNSPEYRFKPGDIVRLGGKRSKGYIPLYHSNEDTINVTTVMRVPVGETVLITDYFNKEHPGLHIKWYVMYKERLRWVYDDDLETVRNETW